MKRNIKQPPLQPPLFVHSMNGQICSFMLLKWPFTKSEWAKINGSYTQLSWDKNLLRISECIKAIKRGQHLWVRAVYFSVGILKKLGERNRKVTDYRKVTERLKTKTQMENVSLIQASERFSVLKVWNPKKINKQVKQHPLLKINLTEWA